MDRVLATVRASVIAAACLYACAQAAQQAVVSLLFSSQAAPYVQVAEGFKARMQARDVALLAYDRQLAVETAQSLRSHLADKQPQVLLVLGTRAAEMVRREVSDVPVVFTMVLDADSFAGGNRTGISLDIPAERRLALVRQLLPRARRMGVVYSQSSTRALGELARACSSQGLSLVSRAVNAQTPFADAFAAVVSSIDCFLMVADPAVYASETVEYLLRTSLEKGVPVIGLSSLYTRAGALAAFDCNYADVGRQAADLALRIMQGEQAGAIPPLRPTTQVMSLNIAVARRLGINIAPALVDSAGSVFGR